MGREGTVPSSWVIKKGLPEEAMEGRQASPHLGQEKQGRGNSKCKGPEAQGAPNGLALTALLLGSWCASATEDGLGSGVWRSSLHRWFRIVLLGCGAWPSLCRCLLFG